jgi:3-hydroxyisobutyrate dehydrogenase
MSALLEVEMMQKIGFIGLGIMGTPMARLLLRAGYQVNIYARTDVHVKPLAEEGGIARQTPKEIAEHSDVIITMLPDSRVVEEVMFGENGVYEGLDEGKIFMDMGSSDYASTQRISKKLEKKGVRMLDAPVTGGAKGAAEGTLTIMVGGNVDTLEQVRPILEVMGDKIIPVGPVGSGDIAKACNQMLFALNLSAASEVLALAVKAGLDPQVLMSVVNSGSGESFAGRVKMENFTFKRNFKPGFTTDLMAKDVDMALDMARSLQVPMKLGNLARENIRVAQNCGFGSDDCSSIVRVAEQESDVVIQPFADNDK